MEHAEPGKRGILPLLLLFHTFKVDTSAQWLGSVLVALFSRVHQQAVLEGPQGAQFRRPFATLFVRFMVHLRALSGLMDRVRAEAGADAAILSLRGLAAGDVLQSMLRICTEEQEAELALWLQRILM
jgi:hypothetical protein